ncbi:GNAT superfamily N-acetyltransferase [Friedmanniella endophytica]|uniref:GNAT superfamily N-acetyltransferase n=1 Tax=Microlunatus kandeliicorticis TaxID=1759536 RepID=A0A7W3P4Z9_9ACTN|nr:DUF4091 domain-containing protein [Microlunatus kandeliicorticis]MBA8793439.1 GNAT superfamily N-acetyltransferase [Microlunatus kandeliicorticis]
MPRDTWTTVLCDSLEKVFADTEPRSFDHGIPQHVLAGETVSVQLAFLPPTTAQGALPEVRVRVEADGRLQARLSTVELVPAQFLAYDDHDAGYLRDSAGLYPDLLRPLGEEAITPAIGQWRAVWVDLTAAMPTTPGPTTVSLVLTDDDGAELGRQQVVIEVVDAELPALDLVNTHWFHCDGLATHYGLEVWSEEHWAVIDRFMAAAADVKINSLLTPVWTPPLDTAVGHYRRPTQLVGIAEDDQGYSFDFDRLRRWIRLARSHGLRSLEISHLFSQWGARTAPAIYVERNGAVVRAFGWDVGATDPAYRRLLEALLPALRAVLDEEWGPEAVIWHVSDEPHGDQAATYLAARQVIDDLLEGCTIVDALSDFELYRSGTVAIPVAATDAAQPFLEAGVDPLWLYYCVAQNRDVSNRFFAMPSSRNRVIGTQLFLAGARGFLHWGFNFYNARGSLRPIDPFLEPDAGRGFPAGDAFLVYPGTDGVPWPSIRSRVFTEAMNDLALMQLVRDRQGLDAVRTVADPDGDLSLTHYPLGPDHYRRVRAELITTLGTA